MEDRPLSPEKVYETLVKAGDDWADAQAAADALEETKKSVLAQLKLGSSASSDAAKETQALADPAYIKHLDDMVKARRLATKLRVRYDSAKVLSEHRRSQEATRRAEMNLR